MAFTLNSEDLPSYIQNLPKAAQAEWIKIFNAVEKTDGEDIAFAAANEWLVANGDKIIGHVTMVNFLNEGPRLTKMSIGGVDYVDFVLADNKLTTNDGVKYFKIADNVLKKWTDKVNDGSLKLKGDFDHTMMENLQAKGYSNDKIIDMLKNFKDGVANSIKAIYDNGKMWVRARIDPEYKELIYESNGVSLEAELSIDTSTNVAVDGDLASFTFARNTTPKNPRALIDKSKNE